jgi:hypothetical protein
MKKVSVLTSWCIPSHGLHNCHNVAVVVVVAVVVAIVVAIIMTCGSH